MEAQRLEVLERNLKRMERRIWGVVAGWILSILGVLVFGQITRPVSADPAPPRVLTVHGISVVDEQGRERASINAQGEIRGGVLRSGALAIGNYPHGWLEVGSFTTPDGHPFMRMEMTAAETEKSSTAPGPHTRSAVFAVQTYPRGATLSLSQGDPADYVHMTETRIEVARRGRIVWHAP